MNLIAQGSKPAFDEIFRRHGGRVLGYCSRLVGERATGEDIAQEVWIRVVKAAPDWQPHAGLRSWLLTIARNASLNYLRSQSRIDLKASEDLDAMEIDDLDRPSVEDAFIRAQDRQALSKALDRLSDVKRSALVMWLFEEMSYERIATELSLSLPNVKSILFRARKELEILIAEQNGDKR